MERREKQMKSKVKNKKAQIIVGTIATIVLLTLILCGANTEILNKVSNLSGLNVVFEDSKEEIATTNMVEFVPEDNLKVYFLDVGQADSILVIHGNETMLIDAGNNEDGEAVVKFIQEKGIKKLNYLIRNTPTRRSHRRIRRCY